jgi:hypothetical protein
LGWAYESQSMWVECMVLQKQIRMQWQKSKDAKGQIQVSGRLELLTIITVLYVIPADCCNSGAQLGDKVVE